MAHPLPTVKVLGWRPLQICQARVVGWELRGNACSLLPVTRRRGWSVLILVLPTLVLFAAEAQAKGSHLLFTREDYAPGDRAVSHADVETWNGSGQPDDGPFDVYLVRGDHPLHLGYLPHDAIHVGELKVGRLLQTRGTDKTYRVRVAFKVPSVPDGTDAVWVCRAGCGANKMFGDLVYGHIVVSREGGPSTTPTPHAPAAPSTGPRPTNQAALPWIVIALLSVAAIVGVRVRRHRRGQGFEGGIRERGAVPVGSSRTLRPLG
jgi:hypothetical protein